MENSGEKNKISETDKQRLQSEHYRQSLLIEPRSSGFFSSAHDEPDREIKSKNLSDNN